MLRDPGTNLQPLILALDASSLDEARTLAQRVRPHVNGLKIGLELFVSEGPAAVRTIMHDAHLPIFLDLKLHDIPETVERAVARACALGVSLLTVHASGGPAMLERAVKRAAKEATGLRIIAVTVLTSFDASDLAAIGVAHGTAEHVLVLAKMARATGVDAFVCSPHEVGALRESLGRDVMLVTPGVRPAGADTGDQKRTDTPEGAIARGATAVVVGRPIRDAADPAEAAESIARAIRDR